MGRGVSVKGRVRWARGELTLNISYHRRRSGVNEAKQSQARVSNMAVPVQ